ncbi:hypothetical protein [Haloarcula argentinensis]|uniref:Uncharacterized protein n=1 Tax=Haloarcula argentinensis TaxID=43776 RepID=A0A830FDF3_HALAR|nr:hypothetical protein [Haloarcula argentinensis]GGM26868.1 hypothetical protein GCM10009006_05440 [Haloarcula argentinensis]
MNSLEVVGEEQVHGGKPYSIVFDDGPIRKGPQASSQDEIKGDRIEGNIGQGTDDYEFGGTLIEANLPSHASLYVDGQQVDPSALTGADLGGYEPPGSQYQQDNDSPPEPSVPTQDATQPTTTQRPQTTTVGGSGPDTLAWVVALGAIGVAVYMSKQ